MKRYQFIYLFNFFSNLTARELPSAKIALLAPDSDGRFFPYSSRQILPAVTHAVRQAENRGVAKLNLVYRDTNCSSTTGPLAAFELYRREYVNAFLGPLCPYVLAPVARYAGVWDIPVLTGTGHNSNFDRKTPNYRLLTRMNGSYTKVGRAVVEVLKTYNWTVASLLFHNFSDRSRGNSECYFAMGALYTSMEKRPHHHDFDENALKDVNYQVILRILTQSSRS